MVISATLFARKFVGFELTFEFIVNTDIPPQQDAILCVAVGCQNASGGKYAVPGFSFCSFPLTDETLRENVKKLFYSGLYFTNTTFPPTSYFEVIINKPLTKWLNTTTAVNHLQTYAASEFKIFV